MGYLAQQLNHTAVSEVPGISWPRVSTVARRLVAETPDPRRFEGLCRSVDEIGYQRHHNYLTVVVDHDTGVVVWARAAGDLGAGRRRDSPKIAPPELEPCTQPGHQASGVAS